MGHQVVPADTDPAVFDLLVARWRSMSVTERVALVDRISADVERLAVIGIRAGRPSLSDVEVRHELTRRRYGSRLADEAFGLPLAR